MLSSPPSPLSSSLPGPLQLALLSPEIYKGLLKAGEGSLPLTPMIPSREGGLGAAGSWGRGGVRKQSGAVGRSYGYREALSGSLLTGRWQSWSPGNWPGLLIQS